MNWLADRLNACQDHGFREIYQLGRSMPNLVDLGVGQADFDVPEAIKQAAINAIVQGHNRYTQPQGLASLRELIRSDLQKKYGHTDRDVAITVGTCGALTLALLATVNAGDEVILFDPYFVGYPQLLGLIGAKPIFVSTYPDFQPDPLALRNAFTPRTKAIILNSPGNPTGVVARPENVRQVADLAAEHRALLISDEIYSAFVYEGRMTSPCEFNEQTLVVTSLSKSYGMTGWRLGFAHGPSPIMEAMGNIGLMTYACAPSMAQHAAMTAYHTDISHHVNEYRRKRDFVVKHLDKAFQFTMPEGAFYFFSKTPWGTGTEFAKACVSKGLLVVPGRAFSQQDSHFRFSFSVADKILQQGIELLNKIGSGFNQN